MEAALKHSRLSNIDYFDGLTTELIFRVFYCQADLYLELVYIYTPKHISWIVIHTLVWNQSTKRWRCSNIWVKFKLIICDQRPISLLQDFYTKLKYLVNQRIRERGLPLFAGKVLPRLIDIMPRPVPRKPFPLVLLPLTITLARARGNLPREEDTPRVSHLSGGGLESWKPKSRFFSA